MKVCVLALVLLVAAGESDAAAAPAPAPTPQKQKPKQRGMVPSLTVALNFTFNQSRGIVGVPDSLAMALGLTLRGGLDFHRGPHRWRTLLLIHEATTKAPGSELFIKGADLIEVTSEYTYRVPRVKRLLVYGGIRLRGTLLEGSLVRRAETQLQLTNTDGATFSDVVGPQQPYPLTEFLAPLILEQSAGAKLIALAHPAARLSVGLGVVAHQVFTQGGYVVDDDESTPNVLELVQMRDYVQGGAEARLALTGLLANKLLSYQLGARLMAPFATSVQTDLDYHQLLNVELRLALSVRIFSWASLEYSLRMDRMELLRPGWQVSNLLMFSVTANIVDGGPSNAAAETAQTTSPKTSPKTSRPKRKNGWYPRLTVGAATALAHNYQTPGVVSGLNFNLTAIIRGKLTLVHKQLRWITRLDLVNSHAKTPVVKPLLKTADLLDVDTRLVYRMTGKMDKVILYAGLALTAPLFGGDLVPAADTDLVLTRTDSTQVTALARADHRFHLTRPFTPLFFKQLIGSGANAYESALATLGLYLGLTTQQIWASGWTPADVDTTPELELAALRNYQQLGVATGFTLRGQVHERLTYALLADFTYPLYTSVETSLRGFDLMDIDLSFKLSLKVAKWVSVDYLISAKRLPIIVNQWQVVNNLMVVITADVM
jgi:hypothetical protein